MMPASESASRRSKPLQQPVLFVVGSGRSGTTMIFEILCSDPGAAWVSNYSQRFPALGRVHPPVPGAFKGSASRLSVRPVEGYRVFNRVRARAGDGSDGGVLTSEDLSDEERTALVRVVRHHLARPGARFFINKNTRNTRRVEYLSAAFPDCRVVHVVRHPIAAVGSMLAVPFFDDVRVWWLGGERVADLVLSGHDPTLLAAEIWVREVAACDQALSGIPESRWMTVYYEDFVDDPHPGLEAMLRLVDVPLSSEVMTQASLRAPANRNAATMRHLTAAQQETIWDVVSERANRHGYALGSPDRSWE